jgi:glycosyltransferase involved in cell wall biosynthesis
MSVKVSVIIPNFNNAEYIKESIDSVLFQTYKDFELIVVDDGSTDNSMEILEEYKSKIRILRQSNSGVASARNLGILESKGSLIAFLDSDDIWTSDKLEKQIMKMETLSLDLVYSGGVELIDGVISNIYHMPEFSGLVYPMYKQFPAKAIVLLGGSSVILRKSILSKAGLFSSLVPAPTEDLDFYRRVSLCGFRVGYSDEPLVYYRIHSKNASRLSAKSYYGGNKVSLCEMFVQDRSIKFWQRRKIWVKFHFSFCKASLVRKDYKDAFIYLCFILKPVLV